MQGLRANRPIWILCARKLDYGRTRCYRGTRICTKDLRGSRGRTKRRLRTLLRGAAGLGGIPPQTPPGAAPITIGNDTMVIDPIVKFGFLTVTCDAKTLCISFNSPSPNGGLAQLDSVCVNLKTGQLVAGTAKKGGAKSKAQSKTSSGVQSNTPGKGQSKTHGKVSTNPGGSKPSTHSGIKPKRKP